MKKAFNKILAAVAVTLPLSLLGAQTAQAALITDWGYVVQSGFVAFAPAGAIPVGVVGSASNPGLVDPSSTFVPNSTLLSWGTGVSGSSSLGATATVAGTVITDGASVPDVTLTHTNNPINGTTLSTATLLGTLVLTPNLPVVLPSFRAPDALINIKFKETDNFGTCAVTSATPCRDIFVVTNPLALSFSFSLPDAGYDDYIYTLTLAAIGLGPLSNAACGAAGVANGCQGFTTEEGLVSNLNTRFTITSAKRIPEPGTMAILGLGLAGLAMFRRRKGSQA